MSKAWKIASIAFIPAGLFWLTFLFQIGNFVWFGISMDSGRVWATMFSAILFTIIGFPLAKFIEDFLS